MGEQRHKTRSLVLPGSLPLAPSHLKGTLRTRPTEQELTHCGVQICAPPCSSSSCRSPFSVLPSLSFCRQNDHQPVSVPALQEAERGAVLVCWCAWSSSNTLARWRRGSQWTLNRPRSCSVFGRRPLSSVKCKVRKAYGLKGIRKGNILVTK